jgi:hypothetical protein
MSAHRTHLRSVLSTSVAVLVATGAIALGGVGHGAQASDAEIAAAVAASCGLYCGACPGDKHYTHEGSSATGFSHTDCFPGGCGQHGCEITRSTVRDGFDVFVSASPRQIQRAMDRHPESVRFDASRQAIQILDCQNQVIAHIPLSLQQASALTD